MPWTELEETARGLASAAEALKAFDEAVNAFWTIVYTDGTLDYLVSLFKKQHRKLAAAVDSEDVYAQAALLLRYFVVRYDPERGVPFRIYLTKYGVYQLAEELAPYAPAVTLPRPETRARKIPSTMEPGDTRINLRADYDPRHPENDEVMARHAQLRKTRGGVFVQEPTVFKNRKDTSDA